MAYIHKAKEKKQYKEKMYNKYTGTHRKKKKKMTLIWTNIHNHTTK